MNTRMFALLACPVCKRSLEYDQHASALLCRADRLAYPIRDGIPVMLVEEALPIDPEAADQAAHVTRA